MNFKPSRILFFSCLALFFFHFTSLTSCGYKFQDITIPDTIKTVKINFIENRATYVNPQFSPALTASPANDRRPLAECVRGRAFCVAPAPCRIRRLDLGAQGCPQHALLAADPVVLHDLGARETAPRLRAGAALLRARADVQADARHPALRPSLDGCVALEPAAPCARLSKWTFQTGWSGRSEERRPTHR